jgi:DNA-binding MarR family transcriptional regulator
MLDINLNKAYIEKTLGVTVRTEAWDGVKTLSYYTSEHYEFEKATIGDTPCLFIIQKGGLCAIKLVRKHVKQMRGATTLPVVLILENISGRYREFFIKENIAFVSGANQLYLPFMGISLNERYKKEVALTDKLAPSAQMLLFRYIYASASEMRTVGIAEEFGISAMQISRAAKQLEALGLLSIRKDGAKTVLHSEKGKQDLYEKAKQYLINPVRKNVYINKDQLAEECLLAGISALAAFTMISPSEIKTVALYRPSSDLVFDDVLYDEETQIEVELWRYNPKCLVDKGSDTVDVLSLTVSLMKDDDPRVEKAVEDLLQKVWEK